MNRWFFWVLATVAVPTALGLPFLLAPPTWQGQLVLYVLCGTLLLGVLGLAKPTRFRWALKLVACSLFLGYSGYLASEAWQWWNGKPFGFGSPRSGSNLFNAIGGFIVLAIPSMIFLLTGKSETVVDHLLADSASNDTDSLD